MPDECNVYSMNLNAVQCVEYQQKFSPALMKREEMRGEKLILKRNKRS